MVRRLDRLLAKWLKADPEGTISTLVPTFAATKIFSVQELWETAFVLLNLEILVVEGKFRRVGEDEYQVVDAVTPTPST
jgi:hypothetical protein